MPSERDPQGREAQVLLAVADFKNARVLEVGCGDGWLTFRYAQVPSFVVGIDTKTDDVLQAEMSWPPALRCRKKFIQASAPTLPFRDGTFDIALFASSL